MTTGVSRLGRSIGALFAGFVVVVVLSIGSDIILHKTGVYPAQGQVMSNPLFVLAAVYRSLYGVVGGYVTARFAPHGPMMHAMIGGVLGFFLSIVGAVTTWSRSAEFGPHWYPVTLVVLALPCAWLGGMLYERRARAQAGVGTNPEVTNSL